MADVAGVDSDEVMYLGGLTFSPNRDVDVRSSLYVVPNLLLSSCSNGNWSMGLAGGDVLKLSGQFMVQAGVGAELLTGPGVAPWILGVMGEFTHGGLTLTAGYNANGSDDEWQSPYGDWPGYTSILINDSNRAGEQALLLGAAYDVTHHRLDVLSLLSDQLRLIANYEIKTSGKDLVSLAP